MNLNKLIAILSAAIVMLLLYIAQMTLSPDLYDNGQTSDYTDEAKPVSIVNYQKNITSQAVKIANDDRKSYQQYYSLWILPRLDLRKKYRNEIDELSKVHNTLSVIPHISFLGPVYVPDIEVMINATQKFSNTMKRFKLKPEMIIKSEAPSILKSLWEGELIPPPRPLMFIRSSVLYRHSFD
jgi:hypothetical protein